MLHKNERLLTILLTLFTMVLISASISRIKEERITVICQSQNYTIVKKRGQYYVNNRPHLSASVNNEVPPSVQNAINACQAENNQ